MIIDSSALLAILLVEPEEKQLSATILRAPVRVISAATLLESAMVFEARVGSHGATELDDFLTTIDASVVPFTASQAALARQAFRQFGKDRHPARLNFGDCISYALAKERGEPLLFKGGDFSQTDIDAAPY